MADPEVTTRKILATWKQACGRTRGKTKDLFRKFRSATIDSSNSLEGVLSPEANPSQEMTVSSTVAEKKTSAGWRVHVWTTWVRRQDSDDDDFAFLCENPPKGRSALSECQKEKLTFYFRHVLDLNTDNVISADDFSVLTDRICHYTEWPLESLELMTAREVHESFLSFLLRHKKSTRASCESVELEEWLDAWGNLLDGCRSFVSLPLWLQTIPRILFLVINRSSSGAISAREFTEFHRRFLGIEPSENSENITKEAFRAMTENGQFNLTWPVFRHSFANFILGRTAHGPGQFLFGPACPETFRAPCPIDYSLLTSVSELEIYDPKKIHDGHRRSVLI